MALGAVGEAVVHGLDALTHEHWRPNGVHRVTPQGSGEPAWQDKS
jgi:hypothetical protein